MLLASSYRVVESQQTNPADLKILQRFVALSLRHNQLLRESRPPPMADPVPWPELQPASLLLPTEVLEPAPQLSLEQRMAALRHCCPSATESLLRRCAQNRGISLLAALEECSHGNGASTPEPKTLKRPAAATAGAFARLGCATQQTGSDLTNSRRSSAGS